MSLTSRIQALTAYANEVTGESDTTLADAVATLAEGYGGGGDSLIDFSKGNIRALIFGVGSYIVTDYLGSLYNTFAIKIKDTEITASYEYYFSTATGNYCTSIQRRGTNWATAQKIYTTSSVGSFNYQSGVETVFIISGSGRTPINATLPLAIANGYYQGALEGTDSAFTFYGLNIMDGQGEFVARFMPWLENGVACVKDLVSGNLFYNAGTGTIGYIA